MKKTRRLLCMTLAVVMLLGAIPAYAATPMTAAASLIALPLSGKLFTALPVSDSISKALTVEEIESTYSTETKSAPTSAPVEQTTFAAPANRLPDGTTGATVNIIGTTTEPADYTHTYNSVKHVTYDKKEFFKLGCVVGPNVDAFYDPKDMTLNDLTGKVIPGGFLVDLYCQGKFICQYDTRDGNDLVIPCAPGANPAQTRAAKAPAKNRTAFNDVKSDDWYCEAVTALAEGNVLHAVFDTDANGNFNPNAMVTKAEFKAIKKRLGGQETEGIVIVQDSAVARYDVISLAANFKMGRYLTNPVKLTEQEKQLAIQTQTGLMRPSDVDFLCDGANVYTSRNTALDYMPAAYYGLWKAMMADVGHDFYTPQNQSADAKSIRQYAQSRENASVKVGNTPGYYYAMVEDMLRHAYNLNLIRTPGSPEVIDFDAGISRAELCVILYRADMTSLGCNARK